jgi:hypothetical protein
LFAVLLVLLFAIPAELLASVLLANSHRIRPRFVWLTSAAATVRSRVSRLFNFSGSALVSAVLMILGVSIAFGFVDPHFGFDLVSLRMVLSLATALFLITYGTGWATRMILRRGWMAESRIAVHPWVALLAVVGVIFARLLDFSPGFLIGVVVGVELVRTSHRAELAGVLVRIGLVLGLAIFGWVGYSVFGSHGEAEGFWPAMIEETMVALTAEGLIAILVAALPLQFLEGRELWKTSKVLWFATFFVIALAFSLLVLPIVAHHISIGDVGLWALVLLVFAASSVAVWAVFARIERRERAIAELEDSKVDA